MSESKRAVAVKYVPTEPAPKVIAKGEGFLAERIIEKSKENKVPVIEDAKLARELMGVKLGDEIPTELYEVVAQVLVFVADLDDRIKER